MARTYKHRSRNHKLYIVIIIISLIIMAGLIVWSIFYYKSLDDFEISQAKRLQSIVISKSKPAPKPIKVLTPVNSNAVIPDYKLPPIENGMAPVITNIPTEQKVVFLTIDDGAFKDQSVIDIIAQNHIKAALFLSKAFINDNPDFFDKLILQGSVVEDHTLIHDTNMVTNQTYSQQKAEICGMSDYIYEHYDYRPILYRPPGGAYSDTMRKAAADCGMKAVVTWIAKANGGSMQYQIGNQLRPGDIVLMHFRPEFRQDMQAFIDAKTAAGLQTELLEDWIPNKQLTID